MHFYKKKQISVLPEMKTRNISVINVLFLQNKISISVFYVYFFARCAYNEIVTIPSQRKAAFYMKEVLMEIGSLADIALAQMPATTSVPSDISVAMLSKQLDLTQEMGADMIKAMENSVNPAVGGNIDVYA